jgi:hypothetical protein
MPSQKSEGFFAQIIGVITVAFFLILCCKKMSKDTPATPGKEFVNLKEWQAASHILTTAIEVVKKNGWQQGEIVPASRVCLATSIERAWQEKKYSLVDFNYAREALSRVLKLPRDPASLPADPLAVPYWGRHFMEWNDAPGRTKEELIDALISASGLANQLAEQSRNG